MSGSPSQYLSTHSIDSTGGCGWPTLPTRPFGANVRVADDTPEVRRMLPGTPYLEGTAPRRTCYDVWRIKRRCLCHSARLAIAAYPPARCSQRRVWRALVAIVNSNLSVGWWSLRFSWSYGLSRG